MVRRIAEQVRLSCPTVLKAVTIIRMAIIPATSNTDALLDGEVEMVESYFGGRRKGKRRRGVVNKVSVSSILERNGVVKVEVITDVTAETFLNMTVKTVRRGSIVYTDKFRGRNSLMFYGYRHIKINH